VFPLGLFFCRRCFSIDIFPAVLPLPVIGWTWSVVQGFTLCREVHSETMGADGLGGDASEAVAIARQLVAFG